MIRRLTSVPKPSVLDFCRCSSGRWRWGCGSHSGCRRSGRQVGGRLGGSQHVVSGYDVVEVFKIDALYLMSGFPQLPDERLTLLLTRSSGWDVPARF